MTELLPGLPDDVARHCLARLPFEAFPAAVSVNGRWAGELRSGHFHRLRSSGGLARPLLAFSQSLHPSPATSAGAPATLAGAPAKSAPAASSLSFSLSLFEPATGRWSRPPAVPGLAAGELPLFCGLAAAGRRLVVVGGWDPLTWQVTNDVHVYDFLTATWRRGARLLGPPRSFFACAAAPELGLVFVAGGHDGEKNALRSALVYDVARDEWAPMDDMARERDECRGAFVGGAFHVVGGYATEEQGHFSTSAEAFDVATWRWSPVHEDATLAGACMGGSQVAVVDDVAKAFATWREGEVPEDARVAAQVVAWDRGFLVLGGAHGGPVDGYVAEVGEKAPTTWRKVAVPEEYSGHIQAGCCFTL